MFADVLTKNKKVELEGFTFVLKKWSFGAGSAFAIREWEASSRFEFEDGKPSKIVKVEDTEALKELAVDRVYDSLVSWTVTDQSGQPVELTRDNVKDLLVEASDFFQLLLIEVYNFNTIPDSKKK